MEIVVQVLKKQKKMSLAFESLRPQDILATQRRSAHETALRFLQKLRLLGYNVVTAESLTAGLICSTLVDIPTFGAYIYGCFGVYDTDAKRRFLGVTTKNVYTATCAKQMAEGALKNSRAIVAIAVTGHAGPSVDPAQIGIVHVGVSVRLAGADNTENFLTAVTRLDNCGQVEDLKQLCARWKAELSSDIGGCMRFSPDNCSSLETLSQLRDGIRWTTVARALEFATNTLSTWGDAGRLPGKNAPVLQLLPSDEFYVGCHEPSWIIRQHLAAPAEWHETHKVHGPFPDSVTAECEEAEPYLRRRQRPLVWLDPEDVVATQEAQQEAQEEEKIPSSIASYRRPPAGRRRHHHYYGYSL